MKEARRDFDKDAGQWDADARRVQTANEIADAIIKAVAPTREMDALDFGCGTGLVTLRLQPLVKTITGADSSTGMLGVLADKAARQGLPNVTTQFLDVDRGVRPTGRFHLIVSSMTLHHVPDIAALFREWYDLLQPDGVVAFADLDAEDGSFHHDRTGVHHSGFDRARLAELLRAAGLRDVHDTTATTIKKPIEGTERGFSVFLITARK